MTDHPLLVFPKPAPAERAKLRGGAGKLRVPNQQQQAARLAPQFSRLQEAMARQRLYVQSNPIGLQPEQVLVLDVVGSVENFADAVKKVPGLEWLGDVENDDVAPSHGFEDEQHPDKRLRGQVFLVMTDQQALQQLQSLFTDWTRNPNAKFPLGLAPLKSAFVHLSAIRPWDARDRIQDTGLASDWSDRLERGQEVVPFEAELWFRDEEQRRSQSEAYLRSVVESLGGKILQLCVVPEIAYHGILGQIPIAGIRELLPELERLLDFYLLQCEAIMYVRPVGQCAIGSPQDADEAVAFQGAAYQTDHFANGDPIVALLDGMPLAGHHLLNGRLIIDDPDGFDQSYQARQRVHGTVMASLICHGDLDDHGKPLRRPIYVRPIMKSRIGYNGQSYEAVPEEMLAVDLVHRAVRRLFEQEGLEPPVAPSIRVINLSVCDPSRPYIRDISTWARLLDWLSWKYNVLFVVSAGNHTQDLELDSRRQNLASLSAGQREGKVIEAMVADTRNRRLLSPAETINGLTVGALHEDASQIGPLSLLIDPYSRPGMPSTISAHGPGYRRAIKPDLLLPGGRQFLTEKLGNSHKNAVLQVRNYTRPPGQRAATPGNLGELNATYYTRGTSNSAALASRWACSLYEMFRELREQSSAAPPPEYDAVLLKAMLVHGSEWGDAGSVYANVLANLQYRQLSRNDVGQLIGYGPTNVAKAITCTDQRVTVLGFGQISADQSDEFALPLPTSLSAVTHKRRLTITLAWISPVNGKRENYRVAQLWFDPSNKVAPKRQNADHRAALRGTVQHEVLEGHHAADFQAGDALAIKVNCRADAAYTANPVRYGLAVTLEVAEGVGIPVYQEVRDRLRVRVSVPERSSK